MGDLARPKGRREMPDLLDFSVEVVPTDYE
jgi:hypothetical protein